SKFTFLVRFFVFSLMLLAFGQQGFGQMTGINYTFTQPAGSMIFNNSSLGSVTVISGNSDDVLTPFNASALTGWAGFFYGGVWYPTATTVFYVSSNGWVGIRNTANAGDAVPPSSLPTNNLAGSPYKIMAPLWDDL